MVEVLDGRAARRERNVNAALDAVIQLFVEGEVFPTIDQVSRRSGLSVRSLYRYFAEPADLHDAAVRRHRAQTRPLARLTGIGQGPLVDRIEAFVTMRVRLHEGIGATYRATSHLAPQHPRLRDELDRGRTELRQQFEVHFGPELDRLRGPERDAVVAAGDVLTQLDSIDHLRRHRRLTVAETEAALTAGLRGLLAGPDGAPDRG